MSTIDTPAAAPSFTDRGGGLLAFGIVQLFLAAVFVGMTGLLLLGMAMTSAMGGPAGATASPRQMAPALVMYSLLALLMVVLGVGSIRARRWARALTLVFSWIWLAVGVVTILALLLMIPAMVEMPELTGGQDGGVLAAVMAVTAAFMIIPFIVVPGAFVLFYRRADVKATCEARDPQARWTDRCPLPVLGLSLVLAYGGFTCLVSGFATPLAVFGVVLEGPAGIAGYAVLGVLLLLAARSAYRLEKAGWWTVLAVVALGAVSTALTFGTGAFEEMYASMGLDAASAQLLQSPKFLRAMIAIMVPSFAAMLVYVLAVRRYFFGRAQAA